MSEWHTATQCKWALSCTYARTQTSISRQAFRPYKLQACHIETF